MCAIVLLLFACNVLLYMLAVLLIKLIAANITNPINTIVCGKCTGFPF